MLEIFNEEHNRYVYVFDNKEDVKFQVENVYNRDFYDWLEQDDEDGESIFDRNSFVTKVFNPERKYDDIIVYFNPRRIEEEDNLIYVHRVFAHEALHAAIAVLESVGCEVSAENEEAMTYKMDYFLKFIYEWFYSNFDVT